MDVGLGLDIYWGQFAMIGVFVFFFSFLDVALLSLDSWQVNKYLPFLLQPGHLLRNHLRTWNVT